MVLITATQLESELGMTCSSCIALFGYLSSLGAGEMRLLVHRPSHRTDDRPWSAGLPKDLDDATYEAAFRFR